MGNTMEKEIVCRYFAIVANVRVLPGTGEAVEFNMEKAIYLYKN